MSPEAATIKRWRENYDQAARELFGVKLDVWQEKVLRAFPYHPRLAMVACAGPGKTAVLAWIGWIYLLTHCPVKVGATSISGANLKSNLWSELAYWRNKSPILQREFEITATEIYHRSNRENWRIEARTWRQDADAKQIGDALRGLHSENVMWLMDETGAYPDSILPVVENIFSGEPRSAHIVQAGNPTNLSGPLYRAAVLSRELWFVQNITGDPDNPERSPRISLEHAKEQIRQYGRDDPWVMINILGEFPPSSINSLLGPGDVEAAFGRKYQQYDIAHAARLLGVDVAREGDDRSVIFPRQGLVAFPPKVMRGVTGITGAGQVARTWEDWDVDAVFIDNTGGFGASWIDQLSNLNRSAIPVGFAEKAQDARYFNRRAEMYFRCAEWVKGGGCLPNVPELMAELTQTTYTFKGDRLIVEPKEVIKAKIGRSPDLADGLVLTFAETVKRKTASVLPAPAGSGRREFDPFEAYR